MKIDKIVFCSSEEFSPFWNLQSFVWKEILNIEPVCILWGKVKNTNMSNKYGTIIEKSYNNELVKSFQLTWSKFYHTKTEPETTWLIGDMDLLPLQKELFTSVIDHLDENVYTHLASNVITNQKFEHAGGWLPAYYHAAKGKTFDKALSLSEHSFDEQIKLVTSDERFFYSKQAAMRMFGHQSGNKVRVDENEYPFWLADERYSSYKIFDNHKRGVINFQTAIEYQICHHSSPAQTRIDRANFRNGLYTNYNEFMLSINKLIDIHCYRPFEEQKKSLYEIIEKAFKASIKDE